MSMETSLKSQENAPSARRTALVVGLGASGLAAIEYLVRRGWSVRAADTREAPAGAKTAAERFPGVDVRTGGLPESLLDGAELVVMSPGLSPDFGAAAPLVARARACGIEVIGEIECFARELARLKAETGYAPKVVGITGTNGKTTTTVLTTKMLEAAGLSAKAAGNIGPNAVLELLKAEDAGTLPDAWVLELSSFQLATTSSLRCDAAALLNVTEDHLDWHGSMAAYAEAKRRIFSEDTVRVLNRDDKLSAASADGVDPKRVRTFGQGVPNRPGESGLMRVDGLVWLAYVPSLPATAPASAAARRLAGEETPAVEALLPEGALKIQGRHNAMNALAALALAEAVGASLAGPLRVLETYSGEPHRVEHVMTVDGVDFIDDSKGTNVGAVIAAVSGFAAQGRRVLIVLGGDGKGQDFAPLGKALSGAAAYAALIGRDAEAIGRVLVDVPHERCATLEDAVEVLWARRRPGDVLLLSPACASWDMFRDYAERSRRFIEAAERIRAREEADSAGGSAS